MRSMSIRPRSPSRRWQFVIAGAATTLCCGIVVALWMVNSRATLSTILESGQRVPPAAVTRVPPELAGLLPATGVVISHQLPNERDRGEAVCIASEKFPVPLDMLDSVMEVSVSTGASQLGVWAPDVQTEGLRRTLTWSTARGATAGASLIRCEFDDGVITILQAYPAPY